MEKMKEKGEEQATQIFVGGNISFPLMDVMVVFRRNNASSRRPLEGWGSDCWKITTHSFFILLLLLLLLHEEALWLVRLLAGWGSDPCVLS